MFSYYLMPNNPVRVLPNGQKKKNRAHKRIRFLTKFPFQSEFYATKFDYVLILKTKVWVRARTSGRRSLVKQKYGPKSAKCVQDSFSDPQKLSSCQRRRCWVRFGRPRRKHAQHVPQTKLSCATEANKRALGHFRPRSPVEAPPKDTAGPSASKKTKQKN